MFSRFRREKLPTGSDESAPDPHRTAQAVGASVLARQLERTRAHTLAEAVADEDVRTRLRTAWDGIDLAVGNNSSSQQERVFAGYFGNGSRYVEVYGSPDRSDPQFRLFLVGTRADGDMEDVSARRPQAPTRNGEFTLRFHDAAVAGEGESQLRLRLANMTSSYQEDATARTADVDIFPATYVQRHGGFDSDDLRVSRLDDGRFDTVRQSDDTIPPPSFDRDDPNNLF
jgi:hypothetical protein